MAALFLNRRAAGKVLAERLRPYATRSKLLVLGLPRGGVPVAYEVALALGAPLDILTVRKLGVPGQEELAMGAIATGGIEVLDRRTIQALGITPEEVRRAAEAEGRELERRERDYRVGRRPHDVRGRTVILVDDGLATGASMTAGVAALRQQGPLCVVTAAPVASREACEALGRMADACVCAHSPMPFYGVGRFYEDFGQTSDDEVRELLDAAARRDGPPSVLAGAR